MIMILPPQFLEPVLCMQVPPLPRRHTLCPRPPQNRSVPARARGPLHRRALARDRGHQGAARPPAPLPRCLHSVRHCPCAPCTGRC
jgi:hypothetical protein